MRKNDDGDSYVWIADLCCDKGACYGMRYAEHIVSLELKVYKVHNVCTIVAVLQFLCMLPILLSLGPIKIYSYGVFITLGLFLALYFWWKMGRDEHWDEITLFDGFFLSLIVYLGAGRLGYVFGHMADVGTIYRSFAILAYPGINIVVGIVAVFIFLIFFARANNWNEWRVADAVVVSTSIILAFGGIAGFLNGSNPGREVSWGVMYPGQTVNVIPVDVWILLWAIVTFAVVSRVRKNFRFYSWYKGDSSVVQEGLASIFFVMLAGVFYLGVGWIDRINWKIGFVPVEFLIGLLMIVGSIFVINQRVGRRDTGLWGKLSNIIRRK